jgi:signal peptidase II
MRNYTKYFAVSLLIIATDQAIKLWVHFNMAPEEMGQINVWGDVVKLYYTLNPGMAFGISLDFLYGKLLLTIFRLIATVGIAWYIVKMINLKVHSGYLFCLAIILGGATGNLIDCIFYGKFLDNAPYQSISPWFHGQVIDMFFFDFWKGNLPNWIPLIGGSYYSTPIFNFADASIFVGVVAILLFQKRFFEQTKASLVPTNSLDIPSDVPNEISLDSYPISESDKQ